MAKIRLFTVVNAILLFAQITNIHTQGNFSKNRVRLLSPEEGCDVTKATNPKIIGGTEAKPGAFPWIALIGSMDEEDGVIIGYKEKPYYNCGGSLITSRHVLSAAHCVHLTYMTYVVRLGVHDKTKTNDGIQQEIKVIHVDRHPNYSSVEDLGDGLNDIAVLTLERDVEFNDRIRPICLPLTKELQSKSFVGDNPFIAGWGTTHGNGPLSDVLMQVQLPVIDNTLCDKLYKQTSLNYSTFNDAVLCAGNLAGGQSACHGDSGGPLVLPILHKGQFPMYQIGIVAYSFYCALPNAPMVYTRVPHFMDWIQEKIDQQ